MEDGIAYLFKHACALGNLGKDVLVKDGLHQNENRSVLVLDAKLLGLDINVDGVDLVNATLLFSLLDNPVAKVIVDGVATTLAVLVFVVAANVELLLELAGQLCLAGLDGFRTHVDSPLIILDLVFSVGSGNCLGLDLLELVIAADVGLVVASLVGAVLRAIFAAAGAILLGMAILLGLFGSSALSLVLLALLGLVLKDESTKLQAEVNVGALTASLAIEDDVIIFDDDIGLRVLAFLAEDEFVDEAIEMVLQLGSIVGAVDDPTVVLGVNVGLSTKLETKVLDDIGTRASKRLSDAGQVDDNGLDTVTLAFNLGLDALHLVAVEGIADIATNVDESHDDGCKRFIFLKTWILWFLSDETRS